ncbi:MAG: ATP-binding protein [Candidatus Sulfopaludibacter sp.]|nr:ATP-binding protein [Candidatus Sulfopaludibacter sp.]
MVRRRFERIAAAFGDLSLTAKGVSVVAIPVAALLVAMTVFYLLQQQTRQAQEWVEHTFQVRAELESAMQLLARAETAAGYQAAARELPQHMAALQQLTIHNPAHAQRLAGLQPRIARAIEDGAASRRVAETGPLVSELEDLRADEDRLLAERAGQEQQAQRKFQAAFFAGGMMGLMGGVIAALLFASGIVRRVRQLEIAAQQMAGGIPVTAEIRGRDDLARLGRTLKETSELLAAQREQLRTAHTGLERRVQERTSELTAANEELHRANEVRQALIQSSPLAIWALDREGNVIFWNPAATRIFGYSEAEVIHRPPPVIPAEQQAEYAQWMGLFRSGGSLLAAERVRLKRDGTRIDVLIWTAPLRDAHGKVNATLFIDSDITERKLLEEQFRQSQKLEAVGRLAGGVAHDFNNLLTVILGYVEMLSAEAADPNVVEYAAEIQQAATRAGALTAQLLAFSRRQISQPKVLDLNEAISRSMKMLQRVIGEDIEITTQLDPGLGKVKADPNHLEQVLMNLVVNARDAMTKGGRITIETANVELDEHYVDRHIGAVPGAYAQLAVSDTGTGMTAETKSRIFEPFFTTKEAGKGTGLGLSIVYGVVKQNNGEIMVYSEPGHGSTFKIYLPLTEIPADMAEAQGRILQSGGSETVLLCEDDAAIRKLVVFTLAKKGYRVLEAGTPELALEICREYPETIDLLLTDIVMPQINGFEVAREVAAMRSQIKVLYMSGYTDNRLSSSWVFDASTPFLQKPFTVTLLAQKVRETLSSNSQANG